MPDLPIRTPTAVAFFIASGVAAYNIQEREFLRWFAYSGFAFFLALGPIRWFETTILSIPIPFGSGFERKWGSIGDAKFSVAVSWISGLFQLTALAWAIGLGVRGLHDAF